MLIIFWPPTQCQMWPSCHNVWTPLLYINVSQKRKNKNNVGFIQASYINYLRPINTNKPVIVCVRIKNQIKARRDLPLKAREEWWCGPLI